MIGDREFLGNELFATPTIDDSERDIIAGRGERLYMQKMVGGKISVFRVNPKAERSAYRVYTTIEDVLSEWDFDNHSQSLINRNFPHLKNKAA